MPFGVNSDPSFRAQKQRFRVRVSSFRTAGTVVNLEKSSFSQKTVFFIIQVEIQEFWGCPGGAHGPYEDIPSNFSWIWSYMVSESPLFNI